MELDLILSRLALDFADQLFSSVPSEKHPVLEWKVSFFFFFSLPALIKHSKSGENSGEASKGGECVALARRCRPELITGHFGFIMCVDTTFFQIAHTRSWPFLYQMD